MNTRVLSVNLVSLRFAGIALCLSMLSACASVPGNLETAGQAISDKRSSNPDWLLAVGEANEGDVLVLPVNSTLGTGDIRIGRHYAAASGRTCKQVLPINDQYAMRIACRQSSGQWLLVRPLFNSSMLSLSLPVASNASVLVDLQDELVKIQTDNDDGAFVKSILQPDETLWSFAQRMTGKGENWQSIAEINAVDDVQLLAAGTVLIVPQAMVSGQR